MHVLVLTASKHGATEGIGAELARVLAEAGHDVVADDPANVTSLAGYDAVVLGSAVYAGRWLEPARAFVDREAAELRTRPTWLFSSGPVGDPPRPDPEHAFDASELVARTGARGHREFEGAIDRHDLGFAARTAMRLVGAKDGDYRDWDAIGMWAREIAAALDALPKVAARAT